VVSPDGQRAALVAGDRLLVVALEGGAAPTAVPGSFVESLVCGWRAGGAEVLVWNGSQPIVVRRVDVATGASAPHVVIDPPRVGRRGVYRVAVRENGAYAYSYSLELSRLYLMSGGAGGQG